MPGCLGLEIVVVATRLCFPLPGLPGTVADVPSVIVRCPPLKAYSPERQSRAARELRALAKGSGVAVMVSDYGTLRAKCRASELE
jgi:hypothetical protein